MKFFYLFIYGKISQQKLFDDVLETKKAFWDYKKQKVKKVDKHGFGEKFEIIFHLFIFGKVSQQNVFEDILETKKAFLGSEK